MSNVNAIKSNHDIILKEANQKGFNYTGDNLLSYAQWIKRGYVITRGQKAFMKIYLWNQGGNRKILTGLFTSEQVQKTRCIELVVV